MNRRHVWLVFTKEFLDLIRDRKTWIATFVIPILIIPFVIFILGSSMNDVEAEARTFVPIAVQGDDQQGFIKELIATPGVKLVHPANTMVALQTATIRAVIKLPPQVEANIKRGRSATIEVLYDPSNRKSAIAKELIQEKMDAYKKQIVHRRLQNAGLSIETLEPIQTIFQSVASEEKMSGSMLAGVVTLMLVATLSSGGIAAATDQIAGEKERGTLESLISTPISPKSILTAKLLAVMVMSITSAIASVISISIVVSLTSLGKEKQDFSLGFLHVQSILLFGVMVVLLAAMFSSILLIISTVAKSFKESQTYMAPIVFVGMIPAYMLMPLNPTDIPFYYYLLPVFNGVAIFKEIFYGELHFLHALVTVVSTFVYVSLSIWLASYFFQKEGSLLK